MAIRPGPRAKPASGSRVTRSQRRIVIGGAAGTVPRQFSPISLEGQRLPLFDLHPNALPVGPDSSAPQVALSLRRALRLALYDRQALVIFRTAAGRFRVQMHTSDYEIRCDRHGELLPALSMAEPPSHRISAAQMSAAGLPAGEAETEACALLLLRLFRTAGAAGIFFELDFRPWSPKNLRYRLIFRDFYNAEVPRRYLRAPTLEQILLRGLAFFANATGS